MYGGHGLADEGLALGSLAWAYFGDGVVGSGWGNRRGEASGPDWFWENLLLKFSLEERDEGATSQGCWPEG